MAGLFVVQAGALLALVVAGEPAPKPAGVVPVGPAADEQTLTVFITGNALGELKPCGCSGGQLGGLERRAAVFNTAEPSRRLVIDTGAIVPELSEQNLIKFNIFFQAFGLLGYDVVNLTEQDVSVAQQAGLLGVGGTLFNIITAPGTPGPADAVLPAKFTKTFVLNGVSLDVTVTVVDSAEQIEKADELFASSADACEPQVHVNPPHVRRVNFLIVNRGQPQDVGVIVSSAASVDCVIIPPESDEPTLVSDGNTKPVVVSAGRLGKYVGKVLVKLPVGQDRPRFSFSAAALTEELAPQQALVDLYKDYQRMVKEAKLLERHPRFILPNNFEYVGSRSCKLCHDYEYEKWMPSQPVALPGVKTPSEGGHANALESLVKVGSDYDPECVVCHVVGMQYESGFVTPVKTPELANVGCENCHGPGSEHLRSLGAIETGGPMSTCLDCHTTEQSAEYAGHEKEYFDKSIHWREPVWRRVVEPRRAEADPNGGGLRSGKNQEQQ